MEKIYDSLGFKSRDASSYDTVAMAYHRLVERFSAPVATHLVEVAGVAPGERVLDVATGTGILALAVGRAVGPSGQVLGTDLSDGMLRSARENAVQAGVGEWVRFGKMDAEALESADETFDAVLSLHALRHFPSPLDALREAYRVLRPSGRVVIGVGSSPPVFSRDGLLAAARRLSDFLRKRQGKLLTASDSLEQLVQEYLPDEEQSEHAHWTHGHRDFTASVPKLLQAAGFRGVRTTWTGFGTVIETPEEFWELQATFSSLARKRLEHAAPDLVEALHARYMELCRRVQSSGGELVYRIGTLIVSGERPAGQ